MIEREYDELCFNSEVSVNVAVVCNGMFEQDDM